MRARLVSCLIWVAFVLLAVTPLWAVEAGSKAPVPDVNSQNEAKKLVKEAYWDEYESAKTPDQKKAFANKLLAKADENKKDLTAKFVLLKLAKDIAAGAADGHTAFQAIDEMDRSFQIDAVELKVDVLAKFAAMAQTPEKHKSLAEKAAALIPDAVANGNPDVMNRLRDLALDEAKKSNQKALIKQITERAAASEDIAKGLEAFKAASATLEKDPADPNANTIVGKHFCLVKADWEKGIPMLAIGSDETLKTLATQDMKGATTSDERMKLGDGWWDIAEKEQDAGVKERLRWRAGYWYKLALPGAAPLVKDKSERRLKEIGTMAADDVPSPEKPATGSDQDSQEAIALGLKWLASRQMPNGSWTFATGPNPSATTYSELTATSLAVLPFLRAGNTHRKGEYKRTVGNALTFISNQVAARGDDFTGVRVRAVRYYDTPEMYGPALAALALCEAYAQSKDRKQLFKPCTAAVNFIAMSQDPQSGGWRSQSQSVCEIYTTGWYLSALTVAKDAKIKVPPRTFTGVTTFLDTIQGESGATYGYSPESGTGPLTCTAVGLVCRCQLGWTRDNAALKLGAEKIAAFRPYEDNAYFSYHATQLMHLYGGEQWQKWRKGVHDKLLPSQNKEGATAGSWYIVKDPYARQMGRLAMTAFSLMTLEVGGESNSPKSQ